MFFATITTTGGTVLDVYTTTDVRKFGAAKALKHLVASTATRGGAFVEDTSPHARGCLRLAKAGILDGELDESDPDGVFYSPNPDQVRIHRRDAAPAPRGRIPR